MDPSKSTVALSPSAAGRMTAVYRICCLRSRSIIASTSVSVTSAVMRSSSRDSTGCSANSGNTSNVATYVRSWPSSMFWGSIRGLPAGASCFCVTASEKLDCSSSPMTSRCTCGPNCWRMTVSGALPGRKPFRRAVRLSCFRREAISLLTRSAGTCTCMRRSSLPVLSTETCISILLMKLEPILAKLVRKARLELARVTPPDPKSGASTNSATFASE